MSKFSIILMTLMIVPLMACGKNKRSPSYVGPKEPFPYLGRSASFAVLAAKSVENTGSSIIYGDVGVANSDGAVNGMSGIKLTGGAYHQRNALAGNAQNDSSRAYNSLRDKTCDHDLTGQNLGGKTLTPGTYCFSDSVHLDGSLTLDFEGDPTANFIFQIGSSLVMAASATVRLINHGESCNVFWQVPGTVTFGVGADVIGGFLAIGDINLINNARLNGKLSSRTGSITIHSSEIYNNFCPWPG